MITVIMQNNMILRNPVDVWTAKYVRDCPPFLSIIKYNNVIDLKRADASRIGKSSQASGRDQPCHQVVLFDLSVETAQAHIRPIGSHLGIRNPVWKSSPSAKHHSDGS
uniref:Uncharacterized protein n=1 Tax=Spongospora subterranea TaxID=70186 RepID=A0A0H5QIX7_9EUKA|eukprot:CRZ01256.1 hypothetical protein [Spongospora subterranea]